MLTLAYSDPQTITISTVAQPLARTGQGLLVGSFQHADGTYFLDINHQIGRRARHYMALSRKKTTTDPLVPSNNIIVGAKYALTIDIPLQGFTTAEVLADIVGWLTYLQASSGAKVTQLLGSES